jgi:hypothetical protein
MNVPIESSRSMPIRRRGAARRWGFIVGCLVLVMAGCVQTHGGASDNTVVEGQAPPVPLTSVGIVDAEPPNVPVLKLGFEELTVKSRPESESLPPASATSIPDVKPIPQEPASTSLPGFARNPLAVEPVAQAEQELGQPRKLPPTAGKDYNPFLVKTIQPEATFDLIVGLPKILVFIEAP